MSQMYLYHCSNCGQNFRSISKPTEPVECAHCKMRDTTRLVGVVRRAA